jgi:hypothetical protein
MKQAPVIKNLFLTLLLLQCSLSLFAQEDFKYAAKLHRVDSNGFYSITLNPDLLAKCKDDLADLRLTGKDNKFFPYLNNENLPVKRRSSFIALPHIISSLKSDSLASYVVENIDRKNVSNLWLKLRNTAVTRTVNLQGSDDQSSWYAIKENIPLQEAGLKNTDFYEQQITFPPSSYRYFKIQVNDKNRSPINILQAGNYFLEAYKPRFVLLPIVKFIQKDSAKISYIKVEFQLPYQLDKLHLNLKGVKFFSRGITIYQLQGKSRESVVDTTITSTGSQDLYLHTRAKRLEIEIYNQDSPPLVVNGINAFQINRSIVAYLEKGQFYNLVFGDEKAQTPQYDLNSFKDSLPQQLPEINHLSVISNPYYKNMQGKPGSIPKWTIWIAVIIGLAILTMLTLKMMKEVNKSSTQ